MYAINASLQVCVPYVRGFYSPTFSFGVRVVFGTRAWLDTLFLAFIGLTCRYVQRELHLVGRAHSGLVWTVIRVLAPPPLEIVRLGYVCRQGSVRR